MVVPKPGLCVKIVEHLQKEQPLLIEDVCKQVEKPDPYYQYHQTLVYIFFAFCEKRKLNRKEIKGVRISRQNVFERTLLIAVILRLYSPAIFKTTVSYSIEDGLRHELKGLLLCNKEWISQQIDGISRNYNKNYQEFKDLVNDITEYIKTEVVEEAVVEDEQVEKMTMFG